MLPIEILEKIFQYLSAKDLKNIGLVSKNFWRARSLPSFKIKDAKNLIGLLESNPFCRRISYKDYIDPTNVVKTWPKHTKIVCSKFLGFTSLQRKINTLKIISHKDVRLNLYFLPNLKTLYIIANRVIFYGKGSIKNLIVFQENKDQNIKCSSDIRSK